MITLLYKPLCETLYMVSVSTFFATVIGLPLGIFLFLCKLDGLLANRFLSRCFSSLTDGLRAIPYIILMIALIPLTRWLVGTSIGTTAAIVPLTIAAIPFMARLVENALNELPHGLIETAQSIGATTYQTIRYFLLPESLTGLIHGVTLTMINLVAYSAMAGAIGGGGLGDLAIRYGYQRFDTTIMCVTIISLIFLVQSIQWLGDLLIHCVTRRRQAR